MSGPTRTQTTQDSGPVSATVAPNARVADDRPLFDHDSEGRNIPSPLGLRLLALLSLGLSTGTSIGVLFAGAGFWFFNCVEGSCSGSTTLAVALLAGVYAFSGICMAIISLVACRLIMRPRRRGEYWPTASLGVVYSLQGGALTPLLAGFESGVPILLVFLGLAMVCAWVAIIIRRERPLRSAIAGRRGES